MNILVIDDNFTGTCKLCGTKDEELRPFGPNDELICFKCGMKNEGLAARKRIELFKQYDVVIIKERKKT